jgi:transposase
MKKQRKADQKTLELKRAGTLNTRPGSVSDTLFKENPFFDPKDLLQVRYEMLRRHNVEGVSIVDVAAKFGVSRPTVYQAHAAFLEAGLSGLLPLHRGPKEGHKLSAEVIEYVRTLRAVKPKLTTTACVQAVQEKFSITIHRRSLERALTSKKTAQSVVKPPIPEGTVDAYEGLRRQVVQLNGQGGHSQGRGVLMRCGLATWAQIKHQAAPARASKSDPPSGADAPVLDMFGVELVRLIAGLILSTRQEVSHA